MGRRLPATATACRCSTGCATEGQTAPCSCSPSTCSNSTASVCAETRSRRARRRWPRCCRKAGPGVQLNEHLEHEDGDLVFRHACKMGLEGIVSKRLGSPNRSGRSPDWLKMKNPGCEAVRREAEEHWGHRSGR